MAEYRGVLPPKQLLEVGLDDEGELFIGVTLNAEEVRRILTRSAHGMAEAAAYVLGTRMQNKKQENK